MAEARDAVRAASAAIAVTLTMAPLLLTPASAQEYCVACTAPDAVYRCIIEQAVPTGMPLKMLCISTLARDGAHGTCAIRNGTVFDCNGPVRRIAARAPDAPPKDERAVTVPTAAPPQPAPPTGPAAQAPKGSPAETKTAGSDPQTVEALAKQMSKSSSDALGNAGEAIAGTTRKAWGCVASLFKAC